MSIAALNFALGAKTKNAPCKLILIILANFCNDEGFCYPSVATLSAISGLDRKTIIKALSSLCDDGFIEQTGNKIGATSSVNVYKFLTNEEQKPTVAVPKTVQLESNEAVPNFPISSTKFPYKQYQKRYTEPLGTIIEPKNINSGETSPAKKIRKQKTENSDNHSQLPDWLPMDEWLRFVQMRKEIKKAITPTARDALIRKLEKLKKDGNDIVLVLERSIECQWSGVFPLVNKQNQLKPLPQQKAYSKTL